MASQPPAGDQLTPAAVNKYVQSGGAYCPHCRSNDALQAEGHPVHLGPEYIYQITQRMKCLSCGRQWNDLYKLITIEKEPAK